MQPQPLTWNQLTNACNQLQAQNIQLQANNSHLQQAIQISELAIAHSRHQVTRLLRQYTIVALTLICFLFLFSIAAYFQYKADGNSLWLLAVIGLCPSLIAVSVQLCVLRTRYSNYESDITVRGGQQ